MMRTLSGRPVTQMRSCPSSAIFTGENATVSSSATVRRPSSPRAENTSAERGTAVARTRASVSVTSLVTPSGTAVPLLSSSMSTR